MPHMPITNKNERILCLALLLLFAIPLFLLNIQHGQSLGGDDYAQYIKEAQNIASGAPYYQSNYLFNAYNNCYSPPQYPPGYPLMLAPVVKVWGLAIAPMCYFNSAIAACLLFCFFIYFRKQMGSIAAMCLAVAITYSGCMINLKHEILSDAASLLFVMLYLIARDSKTFSWQRIALLSVFAAMAILVRTQAVLLPAAELIWLLLTVLKERIKQQRFHLPAIYKSPSLYIVAGCLLLTGILNRIIFYRPETAAGFYVDFLKITLQKGLLTVVRDNINFFVEAIGLFFHYETDNSIRTAMVTVIQSFGLVCCILGFVLTVSRRLRTDDIFFVLVCGLMLYYPIHDSRYFLTGIALVYYYCYVALRRIVPLVTTIKPQYAAVGLTVLYLMAGGRYLRSTMNSDKTLVPAQRDEQAFRYIKQHVSDSDLIICARPRMLTLYTNKRCVIHAWQHPMETNKRVFDSMQAKYLLIVDDIAANYYHAYLNSYEHATDSTLIAAGYMLYKLR